MADKQPNKGLKPDERRQIMNALAMFTHIGLTMAVCIGGCIWFGLFLDNMFGTRPVFLLIFIILGMASAFWAVYKMVIKVMK